MSSRRQSGIVLHTPSHASSAVGACRALFALDNPDQDAVVGNGHKFRAMAWGQAGDEHKPVAGLAGAEGGSMGGQRFDFSSPFFFARGIVTSMTSLCRNPRP